MIVVIWRLGCIPAAASDHTDSVHVLAKEKTLLTEATVEKMFRTLLSDPNATEETFEKAEDLIDTELRPESPLRHRLSVELDELRDIAEAKS